jgi:membrane-associated protease RseP (regulator of RpoE activity)
MSASLLCALAVVAQAPPVVAASPPEKPRWREAAETRDVNLERYRLGSPEQDPNQVDPSSGAPPALGVHVLYPAGAPQGVSVVAFSGGSGAWEAGLRPGDQILEVDGSPVGLIRGRYYEPRERYAVGYESAELLVGYVDWGGNHRAFYLPVPYSRSGGQSSDWLMPSDLDAQPYFGTGPRPMNRATAETLVRNAARYQGDPRNFDRSSRYELGVSATYSPERGATIVALKPGGAAERAGLKRGDSILEVDGSPIGRFGSRTYEGLRRFDRSDDGTVELLVVFQDPESDEPRYYYPEILLDPRASPN